MLRRLWCLALLSLALPALAAEPRITVETSKAVAPISPLLFGTNLHANDEGTPAVRRFVKDIGISLLRWPDGTSDVDWKTGRWGNGEGPGGKLAAAPFATFDGAAGLAREVGAQFVCVLNPKLSPEYAVEWLKHARRIGEPVKYWVLGNEPYFKDSTEYIPVDRYAALVHQFSRALKAADPGIQFGIAWGGPYINEEADKGRDEKLLRQVANDVDFLDYHWYPGRSNAGGPDPLIIVASPERVAKDVAYFRALLRRVAPARASHIRIAYLEWDIFADEPGRQSLANALFYADTLGRFAQQKLLLACSYNLQEKMFGLIPGWAVESGWGGNPWNGVTVRPKAYAVQLWRRHMGQTLVSCRVSGSPTFTPTQTWHEHLNYHGVAPYLVAYAGKDASGRLSVMVINKHPDRALRAAVTTIGKRLPKQARVYTLTGPDYLSHNDGPSFTSERPAPRPTVGVTQKTVATPSAKLNYTFPPHSVTVLEWNGRR